MARRRVAMVRSRECDRRRLCGCARTRSVVRTVAQLVQPQALDVMRRDPHAHDSSRDRGERNSGEAGARQHHGSAGAVSASHTLRLRRETGSARHGRLRADTSSRHDPPDRSIALHCSRSAAMPAFTLRGGRCTSTVVRAVFGRTRQRTLASAVFEECERGRRAADACPSGDLTGAARIREASPKFSRVEQPEGTTA